MNTENPKPKTPDTIHDNRVVHNRDAYRDGYVHGQVSEHRHLEHDRSVRENNSAATGLLLGVSLAALAGLAGAGVYFFTQQNEPVPTTPVIQAPAPEVSEPQNTRSETTIIERTVDRTREIVPVPQQQAPASEPEVNINIPRPQQQAPEAQTAPTQPEEAVEPQGAAQEAPEDASAQ